MTLFRIFTITSLLLSIGTVHATKAPFTGFSLLAGVGGVGAEANMSQEGHASILTSPPTTFTYTTQGDIFQSNVAGMLGVAFAYQFPQEALVLGVALTANYNDVTFTDTTSANGGIVKLAEPTLNGTVKAQLKNDFSVLFKPGFAFGHTQVYALVGPRWGYFNTSFDSTSVNYENTYVLIEDEDEHAGYRLGFTSGAGISHAFLKHVIAGVEYQYTAYNGDFGSLNTTGSKVSSAFTAHAELNRVSTNVLMATVAYQF